MTRSLRGSCARLAVLVGLLLTAGIALPGAATAASAASVHCPQPRITYTEARVQTTQFGWLLQPGAHTTEQRSWLQYTVTGGKVICDSVALTNSSTHAITVQLYTADAYNIAEGGAFAFTAFKDKPQGVGTWIKLPITKVTVPAGKAADIPIVVRVPTNVTPGDLAGGVVARDTRVRKGKTVAGVGVGIRAGVGVRLYAQVAGLRHPELSLTKFELHLHDGLRSRLFGASSATVSYQVGNAGNARLSAQSSGKVTTRSTTIRLAEHQFADLLPGSPSVAVEEKVHGLRWGSLTGRVRAQVTVTAVGAQPVTHEITVWAVPWLALLCLGFVLLLTAGLWFIRRRHANGMPTLNSDTEKAATEAPDPVAH